MANHGKRKPSPFDLVRFVSIARNPHEISMLSPIRTTFAKFVGTDFIEIIITYVHVYVADYLRDGRPSSVQGPDLENQNSLDSGEFVLYLCDVVTRYAYVII